MDLHSMRAVAPELLRTSQAELEFRVLGSGDPVTVFAHGLAGSMDELRGMAREVHGTRVLFSFRGHGRSACGRESINGYAGLAADLEAVADHTGARQVFALSMGAGAAVRLMAERPDRFRRAVLLRPTALDVPPVDSVQQLVLAVVAAAERGDRATLRRFVQRRFPASRRVSRSVAELVELRVEVLASRGGRATLAAVATDTPGATAADLRDVGTATLVIGSAGDPLHPESAARRLARALPHGTLTMTNAPGTATHLQADVHELAVGFLNTGTALAAPVGRVCGTGSDTSSRRPGSRCLRNRRRS